MLDEWVSKGLTQEELDDWKSHFQGPRAMALDTPERIVSTHHETALQGKDPQAEWDAFPERVESVTLNAVKDVLHTELNPSAFVTIRSGVWATEHDESDDE